MDDFFLLLEKSWPYITGVATALFAYIRWSATRKKNDLPLTAEEIEELPDDHIYTLMHLKSNAQKAVRDISIVYNHMNKILANTDAIRVLIQRVHNCGGIPNINSKLYESIIHELAKGSELPMGEEWQSQPLDQKYIAGLVDLFIKKKMLFIPDEIKSPGLNEAFNRVNAKFSKVYEIAYTDLEYFYMVVLFSKDSYQLSTEEKYEMKVRANLISRAYSSYLSTLSGK